MGRAHVTMDDELLGRLVEDPDLCRQVAVMHVKPFGNGTWLALVSSDHLPEGYHGQQDIIVDGSAIRFRKDVDV